MNSWLCKWGVPTLLLISAAQSSLAQPGEAPVRWEDYRAVVERNIFSRDRGRAREPGPTVARQAPPRAERYIVLKGVVQQGKELIAFLEDTRAATTSRARIGDAVGQGRLANITLDHVEYELDGQTEKIEIGSNLAGSAPPALIPYELLEDAGVSGLPAAGTASGTVSEEEAAVLERLRQKREKELGQ